MTSSTNTFSGAVVRISRRSLLLLGTFASVLAARQGSADDRVGTPLSLQFVPRDAVIVVGVRPSRLLANPLAQPLLEALNDEDGIAAQYGVAPQHVESLTMVVLASGKRAPMSPFQEPAVVIRTTAEGNVTQIGRIYSPNAAAAQFDGHDVAIGPGARKSYAVIDDRTVVLAPTEGLLRRLLIAGFDASPPKSLEEVWDNFADDEAVVAINWGQVPQQLSSLEMRPLIEFSHLMLETTVVALGLRFNSGIEIHGLAEADTDDHVPDVQGAVNVALGAARISLSPLRDEASALPAEQSASALRILDTADDVLGSVRLEIEDRRVLLSAKLPAGQSAGLARALVPVIATRQRLSRQAQDILDMRAILLAIHNYHDVYNHFPPPVIRGRNGEPLYSWRIVLLPFLDQVELYSQFKLDEPWNSPHNKPLIEKMPDVFRSAIDPRDSTTSAYHVFTGPHTAFADADGAKISSFLDGTSNTLMLVEAQRDIPWTRPEDIPYDAAKPVPALGGRYEGSILAGFCDGSVRALERSKIDEERLRKLITRDDGESIPAF